MSDHDVTARISNAFYKSMLFVDEVRHRGGESQDSGSCSIKLIGSQ